VQTPVRSDHPNLLCFVRLTSQTHQLRRWCKDQKASSAPM